MNKSDGKIPEQAGSPNDDDQDLAKLFNTSKKVVPEHLNLQILTAAREAVVLDDAASSTQKSTPKNVVTLPANRGWQTQSRWMAIAASLLLAVMVVPLMLRAPESRLDRPAENLMHNEAEESLSLEVQALTPETVLSDSPEVSATLHEAPDLAPSPAPMVPAIQVQKRSMTPELSADREDEMSLDDGVGDPRVQDMEKSVSDALIQNTDKSVGDALIRNTEKSVNDPLIRNTEKSVIDTGFRGTAESWLTHIRQLQLDERYDEALTEYQLFRRRYPDYEPGFTAPQRQ